MLHQVNTLQFEASCATEAQAFEMRHSFSESCQAEIAAVIDKVCSTYVSEEEWIQIDSIEVNMGNFDLQTFEKKFTSLFLEKFEKEISKKIAAMPAAEKAYSKQESFLNLLVWFLQTGTIPWWANDETISINTVFIQVAKEQPKKLYNFLEEHKFSKKVWQRIALQFDDEAHAILVSLFPMLIAAEKKLVQWQKLISQVNTDDIYTVSIQQLSVNRLYQFIIYHAPVFLSNINDDEETIQLIKQFADDFAQTRNPAASANAVIKKISTYEKIKATEEPVDTLSKDEEKIFEDSETLFSEETAIPEKFIIQYAGIVLLGPYFKQLFTHLNLLENKNWKTPEANYRAIHLIRYLSSGQQMCHEHTMVLEKLLCGMEIDAPIPREVELSKEETEEANSLLQAVISNWVKIKNTSIDGLREMFLKRDGMLIKKENSWLLQVERKTVDVLLDSIPWNYNKLAFSWNNYIIFTEW